ncbi:MAG: glycosyltransferase [Anaerolineaceae bacterium]|nr:glycosyltransferase [Anaerolineaceae bacterium]
MLMRIVIIAAGTWGDVRPNVVLGQGLKHEGYEVILVAAEKFRAWIEGRGLSFVGLSLNIQALLDELTNNENLLQAVKWMRKIAPTAEQMGKEIMDVIRDGDVLLMNEAGVALVNGVLEAKKVRLILINMQPYVPTAEFSGMLPPLPNWVPVPTPVYNQWAGNFVRRSQWWTMGKYGNHLRTQNLALSKQTWKNHREMLNRTPSLLLVSPHVIPHPSDWQSHHQITGYLFDQDVEWTPPQDLLDFLADGEKPIYIGFGSMRDRKPEATTRLVLEAVKCTGNRAILLSGWAGMGAENMPDDVFLLNFAPHTWLFPRMAAVIHHGGAGTTAAGLRAGIPSVIVPIIADQPFWGRRIHELGAGTAPIPHNKLTVEKLAGAINSATSNALIKRCASELGDKITSENGLKNTIDAILNLLS